MSLVVLEGERLRWNPEAIWRIPVGIDPVVVPEPQRRGTGPAQVAQTLKRAFRGIVVPSSW